MMSPRTIARLGALVCLFVTASLWARTALRSSAAPSDFLDVPGSLAANADGDVYVGFRTDTFQTVVRRFDADGAVLSFWEVDVLQQEPSHLAEAADGGVFVALHDLVRHYSRDGQLTTEWPVHGLHQAIASVGGRSPEVAEADVYVIASTADGTGHEVRRFGPAGDSRSAFAVGEWSRDLTLASIGTLPGGPDVFVTSTTIEGGGVIERYGSDGQKLGWWEPPGLTSAIAGMDVDFGTNRLWVGVRSQHDVIRYVQQYGFDGTPGTRCDLPAYPADLTVGQGGDLYVLTFGGPDNPSEVRRYRQDCTPVAVWDSDQLVRMPSPTPTGPTPTASEAATNAPSATETATAVAATATETPTPDMLPGTLTPTVTYTPFDDPWGWRLCMPVALRGGS